MVKTGQWKVTAQTLFFLLTLSGTGAYIVGSAAVALCAWGIPVDRAFSGDFEAAPLLLIFGGAGTVFCFLCLLGLFFHQKCRESHVGLLMRWYVVWASLLFLLAEGGAWLAESGPGMAGVALVFLTVVLPLSAPGRPDWKRIALICCNFLGWSGGILVLAVTGDFALSATDFGFISRMSVCYREPAAFSFGIRDFLRISGGGWGWFFLGGLLLLLGGYLASAALGAGADRVNMRRLFGKGVLTLWGAVVFCWLFSLGMAAYSAWQAEAAWLALEKRFGRPPTVATLKREFYRDNISDPEFWKRVKRLAGVARQLIQDDREPWYFIPEPRWFRLSPEELKKLSSDFAASEAWNEWVRLFSGELPAEALNFQTSVLCNESSAAPELIRAFCSLALWRIASTPAGGDREGALQCYRSMKNGCRYLEKAPNVIYPLVRFRCEALRLDALELLLEAGTGSADWLEQEAEELQELRARSIVAEEQGFFAYVAGELDAMDSAAHTGIPPVTQLSYQPLCPRALRFFFPQFRWYCSADRTELMRMCDVPAFRNMRGVEVIGKPYMFTGRAVVVGDFIRKRLAVLQARYRAMEILAAAELHKRETGAYPEKIEPMPLDPFGEKTLRYRIGDCPVLESSRRAVPADAAGYSGYEMQYRKAPAVQVWSVGPNGIDEDGLGGYDEAARRQCDDIRAIVRIGK